MALGFDTEAEASQAGEAIGGNVILGNSLVAWPLVKAPTEIHRFVMAFDAGDYPELVE